MIFDTNLELGGTMTPPDLYCRMLHLLQILWFQKSVEEVKVGQNK
jgi:hypothetical protein